PDYASYSLVPKMANEPEEVASFLRELAARAKPFALRDLEELRAFARDRLGLDPLEPWDIAYASEKLRQARYDYSEQEVRRYLPLPRVLKGLFALLERLFGVRLVPDTAPVWHPDVRFYRV